MSKMKIQILDSKLHNRENFSCGHELLDNYLKRQASQDVKRGLASCTVLVTTTNIVVGYYTLSSGSVPRDTFPEDLVKKFPPSYTDLPYILIGRLANDEAERGKGYGAILLLDALHTCLRVSEQIGALGVVVDPIDELAERFYKKYGFVNLPDSGKMILSIQTIRQLVT